MSLNNKEKVPCIPPLSHQNQYVTDFKEKANIFNSFFAEYLEQTLDIFKKDREGYLVNVV